MIHVPRQSERGIKPVVIFRTEDTNKEMDGQKYQFLFVELVAKKKSVSSLVARPKKGMRGDANIGEEEAIRDAPSNLFPSPTLVASLPSADTATNISTTPIRPRVLPVNRPCTIRSTSAQTPGSVGHGNQERSTVTSSNISQDSTMDISTSSTKKTFATPKSWKSFFERGRKAINSISPAKYYNMKKESNDKPQTASTTNQMNCVAQRVGEAMCGWVVRTNQTITNQTLSTRCVSA